MVLESLGAMAIESMALPEGAAPRTVQSPPAFPPRSGVTYSLLVPRTSRLELFGSIT